MWTTTMRSGELHLCPPLPLSHLNTHPLLIPRAYHSSYDYFLEIFKAAELEVVAEEWQKDWPEGVFPVCMWALQPRGRSQKK